MKLKELLLIGCVVIIVCGFLWLTFHYPLIALLVFGVCLFIVCCLAEKAGMEWEKFQEKED